MNNKYAAAFFIIVASIDYLPLLASSSQQHPIIIGYRRDGDISATAAQGTIVDANIYTNHTNMSKRMKEQAEKQLVADSQTSDKIAHAYLKLAHCYDNNLPYDSADMRKARKKLQSISFQENPFKNSAYVAVPEILSYLGYAPIQPFTRDIGAYIYLTNSVLSSNLTNSVNYAFPKKRDVEIYRNLVALHRAQTLSVDQYKSTHSTATSVLAGPEYRMQANELLKIVEQNQPNIKALGLTRPELSRAEMLAQQAAASESIKNYMQKPSRKKTKIE